MTSDDVIRARLEGIDVSFTKTLDQGIKKLDEIEKQSKKTENAMKWMGRTAKFIFFEKAAHYASKAVHEFTRVLPQMDHVIKRAKLLNVSPKFFVGLEYGAKTARVSGSVVERALIGITNTVGKAESGSKKAQEALAALGMTSQQLAGKGAGEQLKMIADSLQKMPAEQKLAALSKIIGGSAGGSSKMAAQLMPIIAQGSEGIEKMVEESDRFGISWSDAQTKAIQAAMRSKNLLGMAYEGLGEQMTAGLAPALTEIMDSFTAWLEKANQLGQIEKLALDIGEALKVAASWSKDVAEYVEKVLRGGTTTSMTIKAAEQSKKNSDPNDMKSYNSEVSALSRGFKNTPRHQRYQYFSAFGKAADDKVFGMPVSSKASRYQFQAKELLEKKFHVPTADLPKNANFIGLAEDMVEQRLKMQQEAREKRVGKEVVARERAGEPIPEGQRPDVFHDPKAMIAPKEQAKKLEEYEKTELGIVKDRAARQEAFNKELEKHQKKMVDFQEDLTKVAERRKEMDKDYADHVASRDTDFKAIEAGTVEAYRAEYASGKVDSTAQRHLEESKKLTEEEKKINTKLDELKQQWAQLLTNQVTFGTFNIGGGGGQLLPTP